MSGRKASAAMAWLAVSAAAHAQQFTYLYGHVLDPSDAGIPKASISILHEETGFRRLAESGSDGAYSITSLQPGLYRIVARREGFRTVIRFGIRLESAQPTRLNISLPVGSIQDSITVEGDVTPAPEREPTVSTTVMREEIERLPLNGRGLLGLVELAAGTVATPATRGEPGQFSVNGQRPNANYFTVDGVSGNSGVSGGGVPAQATGGSLPGMSAFGSMDSLISQESLQEVTIRTSTGPADFGRLPGATVTLSSRAGSSEFHGSAAYRMRHEWLAANDWFANRNGEGRAPLRLQQAGLSLGGPIRRNRTFFFIAYDTLRLRQPFAWRAPVPSLEARKEAADWVQPVLELFPEPTGGTLGKNLAEWTGRNRQPAALQNGSVRLDHALTSRITLWGRYQDAPSRNEFGNTQVNRLDMRSRSATAGASVRPFSTLSIEGRFNASDSWAESSWLQATGEPCALNAAVARLMSNPGLCDDLVRFSVSGVGQLVAGPEGTRSQTQYQALVNAAWHPARHTLRVGLDHRRLAPRRDDAAGALSVLAEDVEDLTDTRYLWTGTAAPQQASIAVRELSLWAHETWQISSRATISGGLRWEDSPSPVPSNPLYFLDLERSIVNLERFPLWPRKRANLAPRAGFALRLDESGRTVVRFGGGWYYESSVAIATDSINSGTLSVAQYRSSRYAPFPSLLGFGFRPDLQLPAVGQWSLTVERALDGRNSISAAYVGSAGFRLLRREMGGQGSSPTTWMALATNHGRSNYHSLQAQYRRRFAQRAQALVSYTWSHSIDNSSSDTQLYWTGKGSPEYNDRASSDFDLRHSVSAGVSAQAWRGWSVDAMLRARSGFPFSVLTSEHYTGLAFANALRPNLVGGVPLWLDDPSEGVGRRLNPAAFAAGGAGVQGSLGRNAISGFGMWQADVAVRREFRLGERLRAQFRAEAFNALNRASFADSVRFLDNPLFGRSTSMLNLMLGTGSPGSGLAPIFQNGSPRSVQLGLRLGF